MANIGNLVVKLEAQTAAFKRNMADARRSVTKFSDNAKKHFSSVQKGFGLVSKAAGALLKTMAAGVGVATGFFAAMTVKAGTIKELDQLAKVTGVGVENLQKWQFAGKAVGIEADKMGDIFRDASEKLGELAATGGGEAKELFEKLGLDAREFVGVPIDEAILRIGQRLDGLTKNERNALLEMLASDARELIPLLENDAEAFRKLAAEAEQTGNVLSEGGVAAAVRFRNAWNDLTQRFRGFMTQLTGAMAPALELIVGKFRDWIDSFGGVENAAKAVANFILDMVDSGLRGIGQLIQSLQGMEIGWKKVELGIIAVIDAATRLANTFTPSVWAQKFGINFADTGIQTLQKAMESRGVEVAGQIQELERLQGQGGWTDAVSQQIEELRQRINDSRSAEDRLADETKKSTEQTKRNTEAMGDLAKGLGVKGVKGSSSSTASSEITNTTAGQKMGDAFIQLLNKQKFIAGSSSLSTSSDPAVFQRAVQTLIARYEGMGGYDTDKMRQMAAEVVQAQESKNVGSITINLKSDKGETSGEVTGDTAFLSKLASTLQSVSTAV